MTLYALIEYQSPNNFLDAINSAGRGDFRRTVICHQNNSLPCRSASGLVRSEEYDMLYVAGKGILNWPNTINSS